MDEAVDTYYVTYADGSTEWLFVPSGHEAPTGGDVYEGDDRVVSTAVLQVTEPVTDEGA